MPDVKVMFPPDEVAKAVGRVAADIKRDYRDKNPLLVAILKSSFVFLADLVRALNMHLELDFARHFSYGRGVENSGKVRVIQRPATLVRGRDVIIVEDIVDTGLTLSLFLEALRRRKPASVKTCVLLEKPSRRKVAVPIDYLGFSVPDKFVVGYGLDYDEKFRYLPAICWLEDKSQEP